MFYNQIVKPLLFQLQAETAHQCICSLLKTIQFVPCSSSICSSLFSYSHSSLISSLFGKTFNNPVGLAAGFDKNAEFVKILPAFGFGFLECGTVTAYPQLGNPKPRMFRVSTSEALINRLGFNNQGAPHVAKKLNGFSSRVVPLGLNIGKSKVTPLENAAEDYLFSFEKLYSFADYIVINVSSPNTPRPRELQNDLSPLLAVLQNKNGELSKQNGKQLKPLFVKISPDLDPSQIETIAAVCVQNQITGIIATNTTLSREGVQMPHSIEGGLSGKPLMDSSTKIIKLLYKNFGKQLVFIGVGGVFSAEDAYRKIKDGASLVQLYSSWVYRGPSLISYINKGLVQLLKRDGFNNIQQAVGVHLQ